MSALSIDFETRATFDLRKGGVYPYAAHPDTDIWCMAWAFGDEEPRIWTPQHEEHSDDCALGLGMECDCYGGVGGLPVDVREHVLKGGEVRAWNAQFERIVWNEIMVKRYGAPPLTLEQVFDTAADAAAMALPRSLDQCARVLKVGEKDAEGYALMMRMTRPREVLDSGELIWWDESGVYRLAELKGWRQRQIDTALADVRAKHERLHAYCKQDVVTERAIGKVTRRLPESEREVYLLDQRINDRGVKFDRELVLAAKDVAEEAVRRANDTLIELTGGEVSSVTQNARSLQWVQNQGVDTTSLGKPSVAALLESDLDPTVRAFIETRAEAARTSIGKLDAMLIGANDDDRLRGMLVYHGAATGRWAGKGVQPQNFPRGEVANIEDFIPLVLDRNYDGIDLIAPPVVVVSTMLRAMLVAEPGYDLIAADFSAIEARVLNWLAQQEDTLELFRKYDAAPKSEKHLYDPYRHNAARLYRIPLDDVQKFPHRQTGKFQELGCGYQMGHKKAVTAAKDVYGLTITEDQAREIVGSYRETHDQVVAFWKTCEEAVLEAVATPGSPVTFGPLANLRALKAGSYLYVILPSRRALCYAAPKIVERMTPWGELKDCVEFSGQNSKTRKWERIQLYGGLLTENIDQAISRDLLVHGMFETEKVGYAPILSVHDEAVAEVREGFGSVEEYERILSTVPEWAAGCPVAAEGWRGKRFRK